MKTVKLDFKQTKQDIINHIQKQRKKILRAFIAETGLSPSECEQIFRDAEGEATWGVRKKPTNETCTCGCNMSLSDI